MQKKSRRPREKVLSMALMLVMLVLGILCFLTPLSTLVGVQYLAFGCLAIYGAVMVVRYIGSEHKSKFLLLGGVACFLLSAAVLLVWMFQSAEAAEGMMSFICCIVLAVLSVSMGINHFMMAFPFQRKDDKARGWLFAGAIVNFLVGVLLVLFPVFAAMPQFPRSLELICCQEASQFCPSFGQLPLIRTRNPHRKNSADIPWPPKGLRNGQTAS